MDADRGTVNSKLHFLASQNFSFLRRPLVLAPAQVALEGLWIYGQGSSLGVSWEGAGWWIWLGRGELPLLSRWGCSDCTQGFSQAATSPFLRGRRGEDEVPVQRSGTVCPGRQDR